MRFRTILVVLALLAALGIPATAAGGEGAVDEVAGFAENKLTASDGAADDFFGYSVAVSGDTLVVGGFGGGYVFEPSGAGYTETKLTPWASAVAASGDTIVVVSGAVRVFQADGAGGYTQTNTLTTSDATADDYFGSSVTVSGDTIVVGASGEDPYAGSAHVFEPDGAGGYTETKLTASDGAAGDEFGFTVAVDGDTVVVGAPRHDDAGDDSGAAYLFEPDGAGGYNETKLKGSGLEDEDVFGWSVAVDVETIVVGAPGVYRDTGAVYIYRPDGAGGFTETYLDGSDYVNNDGDFFGIVAASDDRIVVGAEYASQGRRNSGAAFLFEPDGAGGYAVTDLEASDKDGDDRFGGSVAVDRYTIVVGAAGVDANGIDSGAAYVFRSGADTTPPRTSITRPKRDVRHVAGKPLVVRGRARDDVAVDRVVVAIRDRVHKTWWWGADEGFKPGWPEPAPITGEPASGHPPTSFGWVAQGDQIALRPGRYAAYARAFDTADNRDPTPAWVPFRVVAPRLAVSVDQPAHMSSVPAGGVTFSGMATGNRLIRVKLAVRDRANGQWLQNPDTGVFGPRFRLHPTQVTYTAAGRYYAGWDLTASLPAGSYGVTVRAFDHRGNVTKTGIRFTTTP